MTRSPLSHLRLPVVVSLALLLLFSPLMAMPMTAQPPAQGCQSLSSPRTEASGRRDLWKYDAEMTLTNGTVIGYHDYWTLAADATPEVFRAMVDDKTFMAGDYPAGTSLGTVWSDLCPVLAGMGTIIEQGTEQGNLYALMTLTTNDGSQLYGIVHILYGHQSNVPLFAIQTGQADGFSIQSGIFINGLPVFEDLDHDALIARLQASETAGSSTTTAATTQDPVPVPTEVPQPQDPRTTGAIPNDGHFTLASGAVISWQDPWSAFGVGEPEKVPLASFNVQFIVRVYPSSERSPEAAATSNAWDEATVAESRAEDTGEYVYVQWFTNSEGTSREHTIVEYTRAWTSADGQWTMSAYLRARVGEFHRYLKLVPETISLDGVPLWAEVDADAAAMTVQESSGMEVLVTDLVAGEFTSVNGTVFAYSSDWMPDTSLGGGPDGLALISGDAMLAVADQAQDPGAETIFEQNFGDFPNILDHGPTPDGGYYALAWGQTNAGRWMHAIFRTMHAPGTSTPVIVLLITPEGTLDQTLTLIRGVTANGVPVLDGIDPIATHAVFEADGPTGQPVFTGGQASGNEAGAGDDAMNMRDVIVSVPALPTPDANRIPDAEEEASYTSEIFGYTITWTGAWEPYEDAIEIVDEGYDRYAVESADGTEEGIYIVGGEVDDDFDVQDQVDTWASEEHIEKNEPEGTGSLMVDGGRNEGAVVLLGPCQGDLWVSVYEVREVDGEFRLHAQFVSPLEDFEDAYNDAQENVAVDGEPVIGYFSTNELMAELPGG